MTITKPMLEKFRHEATEALKKVGDDLGLRIQLGRISYTDTNFTAKLECAEISKDGVVQSPERDEWMKMAKYYDLEEEWLDESFTVNGTRYKVTGLKTRRRKFPVSAVSLANGKSYKFTVDTVKRAMNG